MSNNQQPSSEDYKIDFSTLQKTTSSAYEEEEVLEPKETMSNREMFKILFYLLCMYVGVTSIPTFVCMFFFGLSFWISQLISIILLIVIIFAFGLHQPASEAQLAKSRFYKKKRW